MHIRYGYDIILRATTEAVGVRLRVDVHPDYRAEITEPDSPKTYTVAKEPLPPCLDFELDQFRNIVRKFEVPVEGLRMQSEGIAFHSGFIDPLVASTQDQCMEPHSSEIAIYLAPSLYCDVIADDAIVSWLSSAGGQTAIVERIVTFVSGHVRLDGGRSRTQQRASETLTSGAGLLKDNTHLAISLCRAVGVPARFWTGYRDGPQLQSWHPALSNWFEVFLDHRWWALDASTDPAGIARIPVAVGRDLFDADTLSLGENVSTESAKFFAEEVSGSRFPVTSMQRNEHWLRKTLSE